MWRTCAIFWILCSTVSTLLNYVLKINLPHMFKCRHDWVSFFALVCSFFHQQGFLPLLLFTTITTTSSLLIRLFSQMLFPSALLYILIKCECDLSKLCFLPNGFSSFYFQSFYGYLYLASVSFFFLNFLLVLFDCFF
jgi:hypothetical protein